MDKDTFYELSEDTITDFQDVFNKKTFPVEIKIQFLGTSKQKQLIKITKISDQYAFLIKNDILVSINEDLMDVFDEELRTILFEQEIEKINMNLESGKIKMISTELNTFSSLVSKYGMDKVSRANQVETLYIDQKEDSDTDFIV